MEHMNWVFVESYLGVGTVWPQAMYISMLLDDANLQSHYIQVYCLPQKENASLRDSFLKNQSVSLSGLNFPWLPIAFEKPNPLSME